MGPHPARQHQRLGHQHVVEIAVADLERVLLQPVFDETEAGIEPPRVHVAALDGKVHLLHPAPGVVQHRLDQAAAPPRRCAPSAAHRPPTDSPLCARCTVGLHVKSGDSQQFLAVEGAEHVGRRPASRQTTPAASPSRWRSRCRRIPAPSSAIPAGFRGKSRYPAPASSRRMTKSGKSIASLCLSGADIARRTYGTGRRPSQSCPLAMSDTRRHPLRPLAHRLPAYRRGAHGAVQLALCPPHRRQDAAPDRGHRPRALHRRGDRRDPRRARPGSASTGTASRSTSSPAPSATARWPRSWSPPARPTTPTTPPRS